ncbi:MAG: pseudouridine synthase [Leptolyngbyaceae cyanobacterium MO_188.B28]|nr:pseudouridine synthase [Leptolyngbyaceae cyanobacterium MO_188.B28]
MEERLQKILSQWGIASRRQAEKLISDGRVRLNGAVAQLGQKADPAVDVIQVDGRIIRPSDRPSAIYLLLNKPLGIVSTCRDPRGKSTVLDLLPSCLRHAQGIHPVGRLDADSTGALLLTNDGQLTFHLTHPRHQTPKTYRVWVQGRPNEATLQQWRQGVVLAGQRTLPAQVDIVEYPSRAENPSRSQTLLEITLWEGRNRQIRRVAEQLGHLVLKLHRIAIGPVELQKLPMGQYRFLSPGELHSLTTVSHFSKSS